MSHTVLFFVLLLFASPGWAQTLHALIVADTAAADLSVGAERSMRRAEDLVIDIGRHTGMSVNRKVIKSGGLSNAAVWNAIEAISPGADDVVFFYYVGHGLDSPNGPLPSLLVGSGSVDAADANQIVERLRSKGQRLLVSLIEACNKDTASLSRDDAVMIAGFASPRDRYTAFFKLARGSFVATAAREGEYAFLSANFGGHFTHRFMRSLANSDDWDQLAAALHRPIEIQQAQGAASAITQTPFVRSDVQMAGGRHQTVPDPPTHSPRRPAMVQVSNWLWVAETPVTVRQFREFVNATGHRVDRGCRAPTFGGSWPYDNALSWRDPGRWQTDDHPVVCIDQADAVAYARWLSRVEGARYGLMTLDTWQHQERHSAPYYTAVCSDCAVSAPNVQPVRSTEPGPNGLYDVLGNVWQWLDNCSGSECELRGGAWLDSASILTSRKLQAARTGFRTIALGFRVVRYE